MTEEIKTSWTIEVNRLKAEIDRLRAKLHHYEEIVCLSNVWKAMPDGNDIKAVDNEKLTNIINERDRLKAEIVKRDNRIVEQGMILEQIENILDGEEVCDFGLSFPLVRKVYDLKARAVLTGRGL
jgi:hypothetical protein